MKNIMFVKEYLIFILIALQAWGVFAYEYAYVGCFQDVTTNRTLAFKTLPDYSIKTNEECALRCCSQSPTSIYHGTEAGNQCFCGSQSDTSKFVSKPETDCSFVCSGNSTQKCGGSYRLSIYLTACIPTTSNAPSITVLPLSTTDQSSTVTSASTAVNTSSTNNCSCVSGQNVYIITEKELESKLQKIKTELSVNRKNTSFYWNKKRSAADYRTSSMALGIVGIVVIVTPVVLIILTDVSKFCVRKKH